MSFLKIQNLDISYKTRKETIVASQNVSFTLEKGEILGVVGESGSGKSTIAIGLACEYERRDQQTLLLDTDPQATIYKWNKKKLFLS